MAASEKKQHKLDVRGYMRPYPQLMTITTLRKISPGETLEIILDNPPSYKIIQDMVKKRGHSVLAAEKLQDNVWRIIIRK